MSEGSDRMTPSNSRSRISARKRVNRALYSSSSKGISYAGTSAISNTLRSILDPSLISAPLETAPSTARACD